MSSHHIIVDEDGNIVPIQLSPEEIRDADQRGKDAIARISAMGVSFSHHESEEGVMLTLGFKDPAFNLHCGAKTYAEAAERLSQRLRMFRTEPIEPHSN